MNNTRQSIEQSILEYIEYKERSMLFGKKRLDAEKEYNRMLTGYTGESKNYTLDQANKIYSCYLEMQHFGSEAEAAAERFQAAEEKLREIGQILFEASISADIPNPAETNEDGPGWRTVTVAYHNGQVSVR